MLDTLLKDAKKQLVDYLRNLNFDIETISDEIISMNTPKYARLEMSKEEASNLISTWM